MNTQLTEKTALVCGSSQGIGLAIAQELSSLGAGIVLLSRNEKKLKMALETLHPSKQHSYIVADMNNTTLLQQKIKTCIEERNRIDILINNSGGPKAGHLLDAHTSEFEHAFQQHILSSHVISQCLIPSMKESGYGRIVNIISTSIKQTPELLGVSNTIRGALAQWAKTLSLEVGKYGITVNNVLPGYTFTERLQQIIEIRATHFQKSIQEITEEMIQSIPIRRFCTVNEVASVAAFLCTPSASAVNGINIPVDGGLIKSL
ncbi:MAG: SDR family oxidoreductase [Chitinophagaceae bacterium]|nr:SDR family oxidoreductase [Chitinophagaceae bacterium]